LKGAVVLSGDMNFDGLGNGEYISGEYISGEFISGGIYGK